MMTIVTIMMVIIVMMMMMTMLWSQMSRYAWARPPDAPDAPRTPTIERWIDDIDDDDNVDSDDADDDDKSTHRVEEEVRMSRASAIARGVEVVPIGRVAWEKELLVSLIKHRDKEKSADRFKGSFKSCHEIARRAELCQRFGQNTDL